MAKYSNAKKQNLIDYHIIFTKLILLGGIVILIFDFKINNKLRIILQISLIIALFFSIIFGYFITWIQVSSATD